MIRIGNKVVAGSADVDLSTVLKSLNKTGLSIWIGTQTEHDALAESVKNNEKTTFITYDTDEDVFLIIDTIVSYGKTWSSVKISSELAKKINASDVYTKEQVDEIINAKLASALKYRGAVNTTALLPGSAENGDAYFVKADGFMYAYNSTTSVWDALGTVADMTNYFTKTEITAMLQDKADKFQYDVLPTPSSETVGLLLQYTGADTQDYKNSYFYKGIDNGNDTYGWELAKICDYYTKSEIDGNFDKRIELTGAIDLNEYYANGKYIARNGTGYTVTNAPSDLPYPSNGFSLEVMSYGASDGNTDAFCTQMLTAYTSNAVWIRSRYWGSDWFRWTSWQKLATTENLTRVFENEYQLQTGGDNYAWFDLGTSPNIGNSQAYLFYEITYGRVDGLQSKILVSCGGTMTDGNYCKIVNLNDAQTSAAEQFKLDSNKHLWLGMQSYCDAHVKVYGRWSGMGSKTTVEPTGITLPIHKCATTDAALKSLEVTNTYTTAQIIPWSDGTHYRSFEDKSNETYTDIVTNNGIALLTRTENGIQTKLAELATTESLNYSTEETVVGKWIDGKPVYRRYLTFQLPEDTAYPEGETEKRTVLNLIQEDIMDTVIDVHGAINLTINYTVPIPYNFGYQTGERQNICWYFQNKMKKLSINVWTTESGYNNAHGYLFVYFTKTTD